jgi:hypothetical protein
MFLPLALLGCPFTGLHIVTQDIVVVVACGFANLFGIPYFYVDYVWIIPV